MKLNSTANMDIMVFRGLRRPPLAHIDTPTRTDLPGGNVDQDANEIWVRQKFLKKNKKPPNKNILAEKKTAWKVFGSLNKPGNQPMLNLLSLTVYRLA